MGILIRRLVADRADERGASAVEYGLLVAAVAALIAVIVFGLGNVIKETLFEDTCGEIKSGTPSISGSCS